jgi:hypothetical protein
VGRPAYSGRSGNKGSRREKARKDADFFGLRMRRVGVIGPGEGNAMETKSDICIGGFSESVGRLVFVP